MGLSIGINGAARMMIMIKYNFQEVESEAEPVEATPQEESTDEKVEESEESAG